MKSISALTTIIIVLAVVISISIVYALWITTTITNTMRERYVRIEFYEANIAIKTIMLYIRNAGSTDITITHVIINNKEAEIIWAWDLTEHKYLGYGEALIKPGHAVELAVKTEEFQFTPGVMVDIKILTSTGITLYRTVELGSHPVLSYVSKGYFNAWDYDPEHFSAIYHQFWKYYGVDLIMGKNVKKISISYNMWYGLFQLGEDYTIIHEIHLYNGNHIFFDIKAYKNGSIVFYDTITGQEVFTGFKVYDPHNFALEFTSLSRRRSRIQAYY